MSTEFLVSIPPPADLLKGYDRSKPYTSQPKETLAAFLDAMRVRESVFVEEQGVDITAEYDADDPRSWHWITYASVGAPSSAGTSAATSSNSTYNPKQDKSHRPHSSSNPKDPPTSSRLPVGTVRLVPPPHPPHPAPGSSHAIDNSESHASAPTSPTSLSGRRRSLTTEGKAVGGNPNNEPFIKLGRLAILKPYRRLGLAKLLVDAALDWAGQHPESIVPILRAMDREARRASEGSGDLDEAGEEKRDYKADHWKGLVLVHSQKSVEGVYKKWGWVRDKTLGEWEEEGITHIGMWRRVKVREYMVY